MAPPGRKLDCSTFLGVEISREVLSNEIPFWVPVRKVCLCGEEQAARKAQKRCDGHFISIRKVKKAICIYRDKVGMKIPSGYKQSVYKCQLDTRKEFLANKAMRF